MLQRTLILIGCIVFALVASSPGRSDDFGASRPEQGRTALRSPVRFERNDGQWDPALRFATRAGDAQLGITDDGMTLEGPSHEGVIVRIAGATPSAPVGEHRLETISNYFVGSDETHWRTGIPNFGQVRARDWLPGVDVVWYGSRTGLEFDFEVGADADASSIVLDVHGGSLSIRGDGALVIHAGGDDIIQAAPRVLQAERVLPARYQLLDSHRVGFAIDGYVRGVPVLVDPALVFATLLGGSGVETVTDDGVAVDSKGFVYVTGDTTSIDFPVVNPYQASRKGTRDIFVGKLSPTGTSLVFATYLGGSGVSLGGGIVVDGSGNVYVTGTTFATNFPTLNAWQTAPGSTPDAIVTKLSASGSALTYSTYLGAHQATSAAIDIDSSGSAYITGYIPPGGTVPLVSATDTTASFDEAFVSRFAPTGSSLLFSTYLGGGTSDEGYGIRVRGSNVYVVGRTDSIDFPVQSAFQPSWGGGPSDGFLTKFTSSGSVVYSTYIGAGGTDDVRGIVVDSLDRPCIVGMTNSANFATAGAYQQAVAGGFDAFVLKLNVSGTAKVFGTYLGGSADEQGESIALDSSGRIFVTGTTKSTDFPLANALQSVPGGLKDAFLTTLDSSAASLVYSTYYGGSADDEGHAIAASANQSAVVLGVTKSSNFPATSGALRTTLAGTSDAFIVDYGTPQLVIAPSSVVTSPMAQVAFSASGGTGGYSFSLTTNNSGGTINSLTGAYVAGPTGNAVDVVQVMDSSNAVATATVTLGPPLVVLTPLPPAVVAPGTPLSFSASGGVPAYAWSISPNGSGATINSGSGAYVAGPNPNSSDTVTVTDSVGATASRTVTVTTPLTISPANPNVAPNASLSFSATGGFGPYKWTITTNNSGASLNLNSGAYVAGPAGGQTDTIRATDLNGSFVTTTVNVGANVTIAPQAPPPTPPKGTIAFSAAGGSGGYVWSLLTNASGGTINPSVGTYVAGSKGSVTDVVRVVDTVSGAATVSINVGPSVSISPNVSTAPPLGTIPFVASGGSGSGYTWTIVSASGGSVSSGGLYAAGAKGNTVDTITLSDSLGNQASRSISVGGGLLVSPQYASVFLGDSVSFQATGGSGTGYTWALSVNQSGGSIGASTGKYVAGTQPDTTDTVLVTDSLGNSATTTVSVAAKLAIAPASSKVKPGRTIAFTTTGGSGKNQQWSVPTNSSGASVSATGEYTAGPGIGTDIVKVKDSSGQTAIAAVIVSPDAIDDSDAGGPTAVDSGVPNAPADSSGCNCRSGNAVPDGTTWILVPIVVVALRRRRGRPSPR